MTAKIFEPDPTEEVSLNTFLDERIYEFNMAATGIRDGRAFAGVVRDEAGEIVGAINGHTWGRCCYVAHLWVHESRRGCGTGRSLLQAMENEAVERGCTQILIATHSFQAPGFYERFGYVRIATLPDYPHGHAQHVYLKQVHAEA